MLAGSLAMSISSFNPCCLGLAVLAHPGTDCCPRYPGFNPCCLGLAVLANGGNGERKPRAGFQSLLSWISRFGRERKTSGVISGGSFNPCCLGLAVLAPNRRRICRPRYGFNPCCLGLAVLAYRIVSRFPGNAGFNPCCLGLAVLATFETMSILVQCSVSILVVLD